MTDRLATAANRLATILTARASTLVALKRGAFTTNNVPAIRGQTEYTIDNLDGTGIKAQTVDWLIPVASYRINALATLPNVGDRILETDAGGTNYLWEILPEAGMQAWRHSDPWRAVYRCHVKLIETTYPPL
jgi:hypothetical protein